MFNFRRRFTYANVAATLALVFSMSGGALAATHYLINSTNQINPKVLKALKADASRTHSDPVKAVPGPRGATGASGKTGGTGRTGATGAAGAAGPQGSKGLQGERGQPGEAGARGATGEAGSAVAYAHITPEGHVEAAESKGIVEGDVEHAEFTGVYCIKGLSVQPHSVVATIEDGKGGVFATSARASLGVGYGSKCASSTQVTVETLDEAGTEEESGFYLELN